MANIQKCPELVTVCKFDPLIIRDLMVNDILCSSAHTGQL